MAVEIRGSYAGNLKIDLVHGPNPRRIGRLPVTIDMPAGLTPDQRTKLERSALNCPVHKSLSHEVEIPVEFRYPD